MLPPLSPPSGCCAPAQSGAPLCPPLALPCGNCSSSKNTNVANATTSILALVVTVHHKKGLVAYSHVPQRQIPRVGRVGLTSTERVLHTRDSEFHSLAVSLSGAPPLSPPAGCCAPPQSGAPLCPPLALPCNNCSSSKNTNVANATTSILALVVTVHHKKGLVAYSHVPQRQIPLVRHEVLVESRCL